MAIHHSVLLMLCHTSFDDREKIESCFDLRAIEVIGQHQRWITRINTQGHLHCSHHCQANHLNADVSNTNYNE